VMPAKNKTKSTTNANTTLIIIQLQNVLQYHWQ
jgi:hypothetical protein